MHERKIWCMCDLISKAIDNSFSLLRQELAPNLSFCTFFWCQISNLRRTDVRVQFMCFLLPLTIVYLIIMVASYQWYLSVQVKNIILWQVQKLLFKSIFTWKDSRHVFRIVKRSEGSISLYWLAYRSNI